VAQWNPRWLGSRVRGDLLTDRRWVNNRAITSDRPALGLVLLLSLSVRSLPKLCIHIPSSPPSYFDFRKASLFAFPAAASFLARPLFRTGLPPAELLSLPCPPESPRFSQNNGHYQSDKRCPPGSCINKTTALCRPCS